MGNVNHKKYLVAYLSMEITLENGIKTFAGGLGVLAGDILRSASEIGFPMIGITLFNKQGYFKQLISQEGEQKERADKSDLAKLKLLPNKFFVTIGEDRVLIRVWQYLLQAEQGMVIPVYLLDTDWPENKAKSRKLSGQLYGGDLIYRLKQEIVLGRGGIKLLQALGYQNIKKIHLNEGHGALAAIELFLNSKKKTESEKIKEVRNKLIFTTHTPIPEAQDIFYNEFLLRYQLDFPFYLENLIKNDQINFTELAMYFSSYINAVSLKHQKVSQKMFPEYKIRSITNGVSSDFWTAPEFKKLFNRFIPAWQKNNGLLSKASIIPLVDIEAAHLKRKRQLIEFINKKYRLNFKEDILTITFARRFAPYKRPNLLLNDLKRLEEAQKKSGQIQIIYAGKAHPHDIVGKTLIVEVIKAGKKIFPKIKFVFLKNYDLDIAKLLVSGSDLWLNNPVLANEASGTSGMKAAHNGIPQASTLDGWWPEGYSENKTGWVIKEKTASSNLYDLLEKKIIPTYYKDKEQYLKMQRFAISLNAARFNTQRVLREYIKKAYRINKY
jgi:starch phosphorylase